MERNYCGTVNESFINQKVLIKGWVKKNRKLGKLIFLDVSDYTGLVQIVLDKNNEFFQLAKTLKRESVVEIEGIVHLKKDINENNDRNVEIQLTNLIIHSISQVTPLIIETETDALEDVRMNYRYLDLRRPNMQQNLFFRSLVINKARQFLVNNKFVEVETPILGKPTPEGARDYLVPSRVFTGNFYALPQSPQIYKQLLMVSGFDRYFQVAKCFRDEDLRSDRQPEFTQLDMELSFTNELEIQTTIEKLLQFIFKETMNVDIAIPFRRMDYDVAMNEYGCDKPDLRFGMKLIDVTNIFNETELNIFKNVKENKNVIKCIITDQILDKKSIEDLEKYAKDMHAKGLAWISYEDDILNGSISKFFKLEFVKSFLKSHNLEQGTILFIADKLDIANNALGIIRNVLADKLNLKTSNNFEFLWIVNWPLYEYDESTNTYASAHHPFTQPQDKYHNNFDTNKKEALAKAYDIVLNGYEIGGGSIRITNSEMQNKMFKSLGLSEEDIKIKFGYLLDAFSYGVPPHGGIALGLDRLLAIMLNLSNIKDVIAFPKNANAFDQMLKAPSIASSKDLDDLQIWIKNK